MSNSNNNQSLEQHLDYESNQRKALAWKRAIILLCVSLAFIILGLFESLYPWLRLVLLVTGAFGTFCFIFFVSTTKFGKGGWGGPSWWVP